ncbi:hypothetical protein GIW81_12670 [Hyphomicrobium sp. xq]|uniref:Uncharacterized protein n=1 Tax=Hyphomicrobium album TaxID=2665159 RepID=A0A6I3KN02_9HYPH|nr:hypothetical protein [Hyphomicrobium album]MTD95186.1 hypothetical protein [Hyphomicrobium album]
MNSYRNLASQKIADTLTTLAQRINERFPGSGLLQVCRELIVMAEQTSERADKIARPNVPLIAGVWLLLLLAAGTVVWLLGKAMQLEASTELTNVMQGVDAGVSLLIVLGGAAFYLSSLESRWRRRAVLKALHEFRSIAHVIDMHQLTKDPSALGGPRTSSSPDREMTRFELVRYLSYCSEMLSLASKSAAVYAEKIGDPAVVDAVGDIERLTTNLSQKIWQKITLVETEIDDVRGARAVSAGESALRHMSEG